LDVNQSTESQPETAEPAVGFVRSIAMAAAAAAPQVLTLAAEPPVTTPLEPGAGFVRSTAAASPPLIRLIPNPRRPTAALAAAPGFVRSSAIAPSVTIADLDYALEAA